MLADRVSLTLSETAIVSATGILIVMFELALIAVFVLLLSKVIVLIENKSQKHAFAQSAVDKSSVADIAHEQNLAQNIINDLVLIDTDEKTAAMVMAIVADISKIPPDHLVFKSIKLLEDK